MISFFRKIRRKLLTENKFSRYFLYAIGEIALVMIGILMALQVDNWEDIENNKISEQKILAEIRNGLWRDLSDFDDNVIANRQALRANIVFRDYINKKDLNQDSIRYYYDDLFDYNPPTINKSGYESLKSSGLKTISNDSLRFQIVELYDYYYTILETNASRQAESLSFSNYSDQICKLYPFMEFDNEGRLTSASSPLISKQERIELLSYFEVIVNRRRNLLHRYGKIIEMMKKLSSSIDKELGQYIPPEQLEEYVGTYEMVGNENTRETNTIGPLTFSIDNNYLRSFNANRNGRLSYDMIGPDEFERLSLLNRYDNKVILRFTREDNHNISGITATFSNRRVEFKKVQ